MNFEDLERRISTNIVTGEEMVCNFAQVSEEPRVKKDRIEDVIGRTTLIRTVPTMIQSAEARDKIIKDFERDLPAAIEARERWAWDEKGYQRAFLEAIQMYREHRTRVIKLTIIRPGSSNN